MSERSVYRDIWTLLMAMASGSFLDRLRWWDTMSIPPWILVIMLLTTSTTAFYRIHWNQP